MPTPRHLTNAPIKEAIIDYRVKARPEFQTDELLQLTQQLSMRFPKIQEERGESKTEALEAVIYKTADEKTVAQFRADGFTLNRLTPYSKWDHLYPLACELWLHYLKAASPLAVTMLSVRYINHVEIPGSLDDFDDYLTAAPRIPADLPQWLNGFFTRMTIHDPDAKLAANITQYLRTEKRGDDLVVLIDIDAFKQLNVPPGDPSIGNVLNLLHDFKNRIFFSLLTETALGRYI